MEREECTHKSWGNGLQAPRRLTSNSTLHFTFETHISSYSPRSNVSLFFTFKIYSVVSKLAARQPSADRFYKGVNLGPINLVEVLGLGCNIALTQ